MKSILHLIVGRVLLSVTIGLLLGIILIGIKFGFNTNLFDQRLSSINTMIGIFIMSGLAFMFLAPRDKLSERESVGYAPKSGVDRIYAPEESYELESEAQYAKEAEDYYTNHNNFEKC